LINLIIFIQAGFFAPADQVYRLGMGWRMVGPVLAAPLTVVNQRIKASTGVRSLFDCRTHLNQVPGG
jgi:hypothetical protein